MRTHTTKDPALTKEPWRFAPAEFDALRDTVLTRYTFLPYAYTMGRKAYDTGISLVRPMYYAWPDNDEAYKASGEYMFGDDLLVSPVTSAGDANGFATHDTWLPAGDWFDTNDGSLLKGGRTLRAHYRLDEVPVFARAGAIVPTNTDPTVSVAHDGGARTLRVYPGASGKAEFYEDAGDDEGYRGNAFARTALTSEWSKHALEVRIAPRVGSYPGMPTSRQWSVDVPAVAMPSRVTVDGVSLPCSDDTKPGTWRLTGKDLTLHVTLPAHGYDQVQVVEVTWPTNAPDVNGLVGQMRDVRAAVAWLKAHWQDVNGVPDDVSLAAQADLLIDYHPDRFAEEVAAFRKRYAALDKTLEQGGVPADMRSTFKAKLGNQR